MGYGSYFIKVLMEGVTEKEREGSLQMYWGECTRQRGQEGRMPGGGNVLPGVFQEEGWRGVQ